MKPMTANAPRTIPMKPAATPACSCGCPHAKADLGFAYVPATDDWTEKLKTLDWKIWALIALAAFLVWREWFASDRADRRRALRGVKQRYRSDLTKAKESYAKEVSRIKRPFAEA